MAEGRKAWPKVEDDWFVEPADATRFLLAREYFVGGIWDPACGQGNIVEACLLDGHDAVGTDLRDRRGKLDFFREKRAKKWFLGEMDFLAARSQMPIACANIITNPPYGRAKLCEAFIRHALALRDLQKAAFFVNAKFLFGSGRAAGLYTELPPTRIYPIAPRPSCPPGEFLLAGGKAEGGVENFCWLVYDLADPRDYIEWCIGGAGGARTGHSSAPLPSVVSATRSDLETNPAAAPKRRRRIST